MKLILVIIFYSIILGSGDKVSKTYECENIDIAQEWMNDHPTFNIDSIKVTDYEEKI